MSKLKNLFVLCAILGIAMTANADISKPNNLFKSHTNQSAQKNKTVNINKADIKELSSIKGLSTKKANLIVEHRKMYGDFKSVKDITKVKGIGKKMLKKIDKFLTV